MKSQIKILTHFLSELLPNSGLTSHHLSFSPNIDLEGLDLQLLNINEQEVQLNSEQIGLFWEQLPYWAFAWAAGQGLAGYILANPESVQGKRVLDFGCGSGLVGIAAAMAGAESVVCCDTDPLALLATQVNAFNNGVIVETVADWTRDLGRVDCLLAADVLYDLTSVSDLSQQCEAIPNWLVAETQYQLPPWADLNKVGERVVSTLPRLGDFDENLLVTIFQKG